MGRKLYDWQRKAVERFKDAAYFCINACCGAGKSLAAILIAKEKRLPTIIIAPGRPLCNQWRDEILAEDPDADIWVFDGRSQKDGDEAFMEWLER